MMETATLLTVLWVIGISAESVTAALSAGRMNFDWFGVIALAALTALGGGTIRDIVLDNYPLTWVDKPMFLVLCAAIALITAQLSFVARHFLPVFLIGDAIGLAAFAVLGIQTALDLGHGFVIASVAAVLTGVSGGIMRDVLTDRVPLVFRQDLYASIAVMTTIVYMGGMYVGVSENIVIILSLIFCFITRLITLRLGSRLPVFIYDDNAPMDPRVQLSLRIMRRYMDPARRRLKRKKRREGEREEE